MKIKPFESIGGYTTFDNDILDYVMPLCKPHAVWKAVSFVIRKTIGWHKEEDVISLSQFMKGAGIASRTTAISIMKKACELKFLKRVESGQSYSYSLNRECELTIGTSTKSVPVKKSSTKKQPAASTKKKPKAGTNSGHTKDIKNKTNTKKKKNSLPKPSKFTKEIKDSFVTALAGVTGIDEVIPGNYGHLVKYAKDLWLGGYSPEDIAFTFGPGGNWYKKDWRGKKKQKPSPADVTKNIKEYLNSKRDPEAERRKYVEGEFKEYIN